MQFTKPAMTFDEQVELLESRGMVVGNTDRAKHYLSHLNYYRLAAYWPPFEETHSPHKFKTETRFDTVLEHYIFDRELRLLVMDAIERIEVQRAAREGMTEEELEIFDLLKEDTLTKKEKQSVKLAAQCLLKKLKYAKDTVLIQAWHKELQSQERVRREIPLVLGDTLPDSYDLDLFSQKMDVVFQHLYNQAEQGMVVPAYAS